MLHYRAEIDGLRAIAVIPVILFHAGFETFGGGFVGVDVFFVISGYLITSIILAELQKGSFSVAAFYERRARRILPALFVVMLACLPLAWLWLLPADMRDFSKSLITVSTFVSNFHFWKSSGYFDTAAELKPLLHTWSLSVEEQFYVFFPIFLLLTWRSGKRISWLILAAIGLASFALAEWASIHKPAGAFYLLPTRFWELLVGVLVALHLADKSAPALCSTRHHAGSIIGLLLILYGIFEFDKQTPFPGSHALAPTLGTALIILYAIPGTWVATLLRAKPLVATGLISYSAYLWHQPLFAFARHASVTEPSKLFLSALAGVSLMLAYLSWRYVETPFRLSTHFSRKKIFVWSITGCLIFIAIGIAGNLTNGYQLSSRLPQNVLEITRTAEDTSRIEGSFKNVVVLGDTKNITGVLIGDSHAESIAYALSEHLTRSQKGLFAWTKAGCPPVRGLYRFDLPGFGAQCDDHYQSVYRRLAEDKTLETIIISARFTLYLESDRFDNHEGGVETGASKKVLYDGIEHKDQVRSHSERKAYIAKRLIEEIQYLLATGKKVVLIYPIPEIGWSVPNLGAKLARTSNGPVDVSTSYARFSERNRDTLATLDALGEHERLIRIHPDKIFCNTFVADRCSAIHESEVFYSDTNHLTNSGARHLIATFTGIL